MEYQDPEAADTASNQEGEGMEADGIGVEAGTAHQSLPQLSSLVSIMTIRDVSDMLCTHNCLTEYCHDHKHYPVFVPPPAGKQISHNICHDPSHGGSYMAEGAFYIRIGLPPRVVSGDCPASSRLWTDFSLPSLLPRTSDVS